jgi:heat shock protein HspQ
MKPPKFNIGSTVYHITPESDRGVVIDIKYSYLTNMNEYQVAFSFDKESLWYYEHELSNNKTFNV